MKVLFYNSNFDVIIETERFDGEYQIAFMSGVVLHVYKYKTIKDAAKKGWTYLGKV